VQPTAVAVQPTAPAVQPTATAVQPTTAADLCRRPPLLYGLCGVLTWMQPDTLPLVAYAYVCRLMHDSMHDAGLFMHACLCPCPCRLCVVSISSTAARLFRGSVPLLCVLQHALVCYIDFIFFPQ
jgi:hypothetical protein